MPLNKLRKNRVEQLIEHHGAQNGLEIVLFKYRNAWMDLDEQDMNRWLRELHEVCFHASVSRSRHPQKKFTADDIIRAHAMGVRLD